MAEAQNTPSTPSSARDAYEVQTLIQKLQAEKNAANELQKRKHADWNDNYELYRGKVKTNRLTQRQAINIPLMKETIKTLLSKIDEFLKTKWKELAGDEDKEILYQELWDMGVRDNKLELFDIQDKKNVLIYGLGTTKFNIVETGVTMDALDPYDVVFDPHMKAGDVETARFIVHQNIFRSVRKILADDRYDDEAKNRLKTYLDTSAGVTQSAANREQYERRMQRLKDMGVKHSDFNLFAGGDRIVNLTEHFTEKWENEKWVRYVCVYADDHEILMDKKLVDVTGVEFWPFTTWAEDPEVTDQYPDAVADLIRTPNKVINVWISQMIENRTLKNFQMHWFSPVQGYQPQTYTPGPGVMLPAPPGDDINKVIKPVEISGLEDTLEAINWLTAIVERGSGATAIEKGEPEKGVQTLGEVQVLVGKAMERTISMAKFYRLAWYERAVKWDALMHANGPKIATLYKQSRSGKMYTKRIYKSDWQSEAGYLPMVESSSEQEQNELKSIQKWQFILKSHPDNEALKKIALKRELELLDLSPEELKEVEEAAKAPPPPAPNMPPGMPGQNGENVSPEDMDAISKGVMELGSLAAARNQ